MIVVRTGGSDDAAVIDELRRLGEGEAVEKRGGELLVASIGTQERDVRALAPVERTIVAEIDGELIGCATVVRSGRTALLRELFTHPDARGVGVGDALLRSVVDQAVAWECTGLDSFALPGDRDTKNFFESHGMKARLLVVHTDLTPLRDGSAAAPDDESNAGTTTGPIDATVSSVATVSSDAAVSGDVTMSNAPDGPRDVTGSSQPPAPTVP